MKRRIILSILSAFLMLSCSDNTNSTVEAKPNTDTNKNKSLYTWAKSVHTSLGVPFDKDTTDDYLIIRPQYVVSYSGSKGQPNWVASELNAAWYGDVERYEGNFITDNSLPTSFYKVKDGDYTNSGYDRGHLVRSEERTATVDDNKSTFIMSNVFPQTPDLNRGVWLKLEYECERLCKEENKELFVVAGGIFHSNKTLNDAGKVVIPDSCFKIVVVLDKGQTLANVTKTTKVIAVVMPNIAGIRTDAYSKYLTTVDRIEASTGYDFLNEISDSVEESIESK
jgi:endonuclease G